MYSARPAAQFAGAVFVALALTVALSVFLIPVFGLPGGSVVSLALGVGVGRLLKP